MSRPNDKTVFDLSWTNVPAGNRIRYLWQEWLQNHLESYHGGVLLTLDSLTQCLNLPSNAFEDCIKIGDRSDHSLHANPEELPIMTDSVKSIVISNGFEYTENPSILLGEIHRCLEPQGTLYCLMYAPHNPWYYKYALYLSKQRRDLPLHQLTLTRYKDWLQLLGFKIHEVEAIGCPWWRGFQKFKLKSDMRKAWLSAPIAYMIKAQKKVSTLTPIKPLEEEMAVAMNSGLASYNRNMNRNLCRNMNRNMVQDQ